MFVYMLCERDLDDRLSDHPFLCNFAISIAVYIYEQGLGDLEFRFCAVMLMPLSSIYAII